MAVIKIEKQFNSVYVHLSGNFLGNEETDSLADTLSEILDSENKNVKIIFNENTYLNSISLGVLISFNSKFHKIKGSITLVNPNENLRKLFEITKLDKIFKIINTE